MFFLVGVAAAAAAAGVLGERWRQAKAASAEPSADPPEVEVLRRKIDVRVAAHEAGHAVLAWVSPFTARVSEVTIKENGDSGGRTLYHTTCDPEKVTGSRAIGVHWYCAAISLGGMAGELLTHKKVRSGHSAADLHAARVSAERICALGGVSACPWEPLGDEAKLDIGAMFKIRPSPEVVRVLEVSYRRSKAVLVRDRVRFDALTAALLKKETVVEHELYATLGERPRFRM